MRFLVVLACILCLPLSSSAGNIKDMDLIASNAIFLDPNTNRTVYTQLRNASENQPVTLNGLNTKLTAKGYQLVKDPEQANYWIQAKIIYCHKAAEGVTPENMTKAGAGISSGGKTIGAPVGGQNTNSQKVRQMRMVGHV